MQLARGGAGGSAQRRRVSAGAGHGLFFFFHERKKGRGALLPSPSPASAMIYAVRSAQFAQFLTWACQNRRLPADHGYYDEAALHVHD